MTKDDIYSLPIDSISPFTFDQKVAAVFDDMVSRSIPHYMEVQEYIRDIVTVFAKPYTTVWDLGCSTGTMLALLADSFCQVAEFNEENFPKLFGIDNSEAMLKACHTRLLQKNKRVAIKTSTDVSDAVNIEILLSLRDIEDTKISNASAVVINYTLQFLDIRKRLQILKEIASGLIKGGILVVSEKVIHSESSLEEAIVELHYKFKYNCGYSKLEIAQKREALERVLCPISVEDNLEILQNAGFFRPQILCKHLNFATFVAVKQ